jgi:hypothetical protein
MEARDTLLGPRLCGRAGDRLVSDHSSSEGSGGTTQTHSLQFSIAHLYQRPAEGSPGRQRRTHPAGEKTGNRASSGRARGLSGPNQICAYWNDWLGVGGYDTPNIWHLRKGIGNDGFVAPHKPFSFPSLWTLPSMPKIAVESHS